MSSNALHHLVYHSSASAPFSEAELKALLTQARAWNTAHGLTGVLLYCDGEILQVLEGTEAEVKALFAKIQRDYRHQGVTKLADGPIPQRSFADWSMGFATVSPDAYRHLSGYFALEDTDSLVAPSALDADSLLELLSSFVHQTAVRF